MASRIKRLVPVTVNDVLAGHAGLDLERLDRLYLHGYLGQLQVGGQVIQFLNHRGFPVPSPACLQLLQAAATIAPPRALSRSERWRYPDIAALADVLDVENAPLDGINDALSADPALLAGWLRAVARAAGLDLPGIAAQTQAALQSWPARNRDIMYVMFAPPPAPGCDPARLDAAGVTLLIEALGATSEWLAGSAYVILVAARPGRGEPGCGRARANARGPAQERRDRGHRQRH